MNSSKSADNWTLPPQDDGVDIPGVGLVVAASKTGEQRPNQLPAPPPAEVFTTTVSNILEWSVAETITEAGTLSTVGLEKRSSKGRGGRPQAAVADSEIPQETSICDFACRSPENPDTLYLRVVGIPSPPKRTIPKKIDFCNYDKKIVADEDKWEVDSDGEVGPFFDAIADEKEFDDGRESPVSMGGEGATEVKDQAGKFVPLSNNNINAMKKDQLYTEILQRGVK